MKNAMLKMIAAKMRPRPTRLPQLQQQHPLALQKILMIALSVVPLQASMRAMLETVVILSIVTALTTLFINVEQMRNFVIQLDYVSP